MNQSEFVILINFKAQDNSQDETAFKKDLLNIAKTTLSSKLVTSDKDCFA